MPITWKLRTRRLVDIASFTDPGTVYTADITSKTCTCPAYAADQSCKHLQQLGVYNHKPFFPKTNPTFSQALSGMVKSIRLRKLDEAIYWMVYLSDWKGDFRGTAAAYRTRLAKRILICSAEDGHSIAVMERNAENYSHNAKLTTDPVYLAADIARICAVPNWWDPITGGHDYIRHGMLGDRLSLSKPDYLEGEERCKAALVKAIQEQDKVLALAAIHANPMNRGKWADFVYECAVQAGNAEATRLAAIHTGHRTPLSNDNNFICQAAWLMTGGQTGVAFEEPALFAGEMYSLVQKAVESWKTPHLIPRWCCDGVHSSGDDPRFGGIWQNMDAVCRAYDKFGRVDPDDKWGVEMYDWTGLPIIRERLVPAINCKIGLTNP